MSAACPSAWERCNFPPQQAPAISNEKPGHSLKLGYVLGCSSQCAPNSVQYTSDGGIVYCASNVAVVYVYYSLFSPPDPPYRSGSTRQQRHYFGHRSPIHCLTVSPNGSVVASGDRSCDSKSSPPFIHLWSPLSCEAIDVVPSAGPSGHGLRGSIRTLVFNSTGSQLAVVGGDECDPQLVLLSSDDEWKSHTVSFRGHLPDARFRFCFWTHLSTDSSPRDGVPAAPAVTDDSEAPITPSPEAEAPESEEMLILGGKKNLFKYSQGQFTAFVLGKHESEVFVTGAEVPWTEEPKPVGEDGAPRSPQHSSSAGTGGIRESLMRASVRSTMALKMPPFGEHQLLFCTASGLTLVWEEERGFVEVHRNHTSPVVSVLPLPPSAAASPLRYLTVDCSGTVVLCNGAHSVLRKLELSSLGRSYLSALAVHSVSYCIKKRSLLVGTQQSVVLEVLFDDGFSPAAVRCPVSAPKTAVQGLAMHPKIPSVFAYCDAEGIVRVWDSQQRQHAGSFQTPGTVAGCCSFRGDGCALAVGWSSKGRAGVSVLRYPDLSELHSLCLSPAEIPTVLQFSPDEAHLAVGTASGSVQLLEPSADGADSLLVSKSVSYSWAPLAMDFCPSGLYLRVAYSDCSLQFIDLSTPTADILATPSMLREESWCSQSSPFGWAVQGAWAVPPDPRALPRCARSHAEDLVALSSPEGSIRLYRYPCVFRHEAQHTDLFLHCGLVRGLGFSSDDRLLVSIGGCDPVIALWEITAPVAEEEEAVGEETAPSDAEALEEDE